MPSPCPPGPPTGPVVTCMSGAGPFGPVTPPGAVVCPAPTVPPPPGHTMLTVVTGVCPGPGGGVTVQYLNVFVPIGFLLTGTVFCVDNPTDCCSPPSGSGSGGGGGSGGGTVTVPCCPNPLPTILRLTFSGSCPCFNTLPSINMTWDPAHQRWASTLINTCGGALGPQQMFLECAEGQWILSRLFDVCWIPHNPPNLVACDPFHLHWNAMPGQDACCDPATDVIIDITT